MSDAQPDQHEADMRYMPFTHRPKERCLAMGAHNLDLEQTPYSAVLMVSNGHACISLVDTRDAQKEIPQLSFWATDEVGAHLHTQHSLLLPQVCFSVLAAGAGVLGQDSIATEILDYYMASYAVSAVMLASHCKSGTFKKPTLDARYVGVIFPLSEAQYQTLALDFEYLKMHPPEYGVLGLRELCDAQPIPWLKGKSGDNCMSVARRVMLGAGIDVHQRLGVGIGRVSPRPKVWHTAIKTHIESVHNGIPPKRPQTYCWFGEGGPQPAKLGAGILVAD